MPMTLEQAQTKLDYWMNLQEEAAKSQSYNFESGGFRRQKAMADLERISEQVKIWEWRVDRLSRGGMQVRRAVPV